jgi:branched-chain amino acid transport system substrate-binding protein
LTADAPQATVRKFDEAFQREFKSRADHNGLKGYSGMYIVKAVTEKIGKFDPKAFAVAMHGISLTVKDHPGILLDVNFDANGDLDRESYMTRVVGGKQVVSDILPPVNKK